MAPPGETQSHKATVVAQTLGLADHMQPRPWGPSASQLAAQGPAITATTPQRYLKRAFSAPRICTVEAGYLARFVRLPAWEMRRAPTWEGGWGLRLPPTTMSPALGRMQSPRPGISNKDVSSTAQWIDRFAQTSSPQPGATRGAHTLALTTSPMRAERLGATWLILERRYSCRPLRYSESEMTRLEKLSMLMRSRGEMSIPGKMGVGG